MEEAVLYYNRCRAWGGVRVNRPEGLTQPEVFY